MWTFILWLILLVVCWPLALLFLLLYPLIWLLLLPFRLVGLVFLGLVLLLDPLAAHARGTWLSFGAVGALLLALGGARQSRWPAATLLRVQLVLFAGLRERLAQLAERSPDSTFAALAAAETERLAGDLAAQEGRLDAATAHWRHALASLPADAERRTPDEQCAALGTNAALGQVSAARSIAATLQASGYRHPNCAAFADFSAAESTSGNAVGDDDPGVSANDR